LIPKILRGSRMSYQVRALALAGEKIQEIPVRFYRDKTVAWEGWGKAMREGFRCRLNGRGGYQKKRNTN